MAQESRLRVKFLNGLMLDVPSSSTGRTLKEYLSVNGLLTSADIMLVQSGKEIGDSSAVGPVIYALLRSNCSVKPLPTIQVTIKFGKNKYQIVGNAHSKIFSIKRTIERLIKVNSSSIRLIMNGCIMKDSYLLGDYILHAAKKNPNEFVIHITKVFDVKKEVDVYIHFTNGCKDKPLTFSYSISEPIAHMREVLFTRFMLPKSLMLVLTLRDSNEKMVKLDTCKRLVDYSIGSPSNISNKVNIYMYRADDDILDDVSATWSKNSTGMSAVKVIKRGNSYEDDKENVSTQTRRFKRGFLCSNNKNNAKKGK